MKVFPDAYADQLSTRYGPDIADQITDPSAMRRAELPDQPGQSLPFVEVHPIGSEPMQRKVLYVPGFGENIINKASFAAELAMRGQPVILPGQNRGGTLRDETGRRSSLYTQARNYLALCDTMDQPADIITHSYGSLVFDEMTRLEPDTFKGSNVIFLAPAGSIYDQRLLAMGRQWLRFMKSESDQARPMEFPDKKNYTGRASAKTLAANPLRTAREVSNLYKREVDYERLAEAVASLAVLSYAEDLMFPEKALSPMLSDAVKAGYIRWATPVSPERVQNGEMAYGGEGAVHDDEQYNPSRVAGALLQFLNRAP